MSHCCQAQGRGRKMVYGHAGVQQGGKRNGATAISAVLFWCPDVSSNLVIWCILTLQNCTANHGAVCRGNFLRQRWSARRVSTVSQFSTSQQVTGEMPQPNSFAWFIKTMGQKQQRKALIALVPNKIVVAGSKYWRREVRWVGKAGSRMSPLHVQRWRKL